MIIVLLVKSATIISPMKIVLGCVHWIPSWCQLESVFCL